mgnify:CR=1 FL=1
MGAPTFFLYKCIVISYNRSREMVKNIMGKEHRCIDVYKNEYYRAGKLLNDSLDIIPGETILFDEEE